MVANYTIIFIGSFPSKYPINYVRNWLGHEYGY